MEELCQWFPLVAQRILNNVDDLALISFKEAGRNNAEFLGKGRFYWTRIIKRYNCLIGDLQEVGKTSVEIIKELAVAVHQFPLAMSRKCRNVYIALLTPVDFVQKVGKEWHPLFAGATCKFFIMSTEFDKNISDWRYDCTDYKNGFDFFMRLVKWPEIAVN